MFHKAHLIARLALVSAATINPSFPLMAAAPTPAAANAWMKKATLNPLAKDLISEDVRAARDQFFDGSFGLAEPVSFDPKQQSHIGKPVTQPDLTDVPEIPSTINRVTVTATFTSSQSVLSRSGRSVYTEIIFTINRVFEDREGQLTSGKTLTAIIPGGSVQTSTGTLSYLVDPEDTFIQPQKRYLLILSHNTSGQFYTVVKNWELSNKVVKANSKQDLLRAAAGKSVLANVSEDNLQSVLFDLLIAHP